MGGGSEWDTEGTTNLERISDFDVYNLKKKLHVLQTVFSLFFVFGFCIGTQNGGWCKFWIVSYLDAGEFERTKEDWGLSYQGSLHVAGLSFSSMPPMTVWHTCVMISRPPKPDLGQPEARVKQPPFPSRVIWECFYWIKKVISLLIEFHQFFSIYREWLSPWFTGAPKP